MRRFLRSIAGKTVSFILCMIAVSVFVAGVSGAAVMVEENYYTQSKDQIYERFIITRLYSDGFNSVWSVVSDYDGQIVYVSNEQLDFEVRDREGNLIGKEAQSKKVDEWTYSYEYGVLRDEEGYVSDIFYHDPNASLVDEAEYYIFNANIKDHPGISSYSTIKKIVDLSYSLRYWIFLIDLAALLIAIASFVVLMTNAGRRNDTDELFPGPLSKIPFDLLMALYLLSGFVCLVIIGQNHLSDAVTVIVYAVMFAVYLFLFLGLCVSLSVRIKQKNLIKGSVFFFCLKYLRILLRYFYKLLRRILELFVSFIRNIPLVRKTVLITSVLVFIEFIIYLNISYGDFLVFMFIRNMILFPLIIYFALNLKTLQKGGIALANGDLSYHVDTKRMFWDFKKHGENLNSIAKGMSIAVEDRLKSERMKTELITNVSHDIKTPLTSIINYADLIGKQETDKQKIKEYAEVLLRQSERLKRLIEDLVEASKASTGNLEVNLVSCDAATFVNQAAGEYEDRMKQCGLSLITSYPEEKLSIMADGRRMWRIFDNLMNNICKYAQKNTRVYLSLEKKEDLAVFVFKNISAQQLNISEEELMERFTRGDQSRNTEGNGLGLSIAKSMAELQNGSLKIEIDGDLFKAKLSFPIID